MTDKLREAIRAAFNAGCDQGSDEATAYEWGAYPQQKRDDAFADFMAEWNPDSAPLRAALAAAPQPAPDGEQCARCCGNGEIVTDWDEYLRPPEGAEGDHATMDCPDCDGTGAAPQPAPVERQALMDLIWDAAKDGDKFLESGGPEAIADALLARGLRLPGGDETMAWAVVEKDGTINPNKISEYRPNYVAKVMGDHRVKRVAIRVVEGDDNAA